MQFPDTVGQSVQSQLHPSLAAFLLQYEKDIDDFIHYLRGQWPDPAAMSAQDRRSWERARRLFRSALDGLQALRAFWEKGELRLGDHEGMVAYNRLSSILMGAGYATEEEIESVLNLLWQAMDDSHTLSALDRAAMAKLAGELKRRYVDTLL